MIFMKPNAVILVVS